MNTKTDATSAMLGSKLAVDGRIAVDLLSGPQCPESTDCQTDSVANELVFRPAWTSNR